MPVGIWRMSSWARSRTSSDVVRTVPRSTAVSGMMFGAVPLVRLPTVSTSGSNVLIRRLRIVCRARTISAAIGTGSSARCGDDAWPPAPRTVIVNRSPAA